MFSYTSDDALTVPIYPRRYSYCSRIPPSVALTVLIYLPAILLLFSYTPGVALTVLIYPRRGLTVRIYPRRYSYCSHIPQVMFLLFPYTPGEVLTVLIYHLAILLLFLYTPRNVLTVLIYPRRCSYCSHIPPAILLLFSFTPG